MSHTHTPARRGAWSILSAGTLWGTTGVTTQALYKLGAANALSIAFFRLGIGAFIFLLLCALLLRRRMWSIKRRDVLLLILMGIMQAIFQVGYLAAIPYCGVTIATLITLCVAPVIVVLFSTLFLHERLTLKILLALACALGGTALLTGTPGGATSFTRLLLGVVLSLSSAAGYAGIILGGRALSGRYHALQINATSFGVGALLLLICLFTTPLVLHYTTTGWLFLLYLGCIPTALAYILFQSGMRSVSATTTSILTLSEPLTAAILAWLLFGERLGPLGIVGAFLLLGTILLLALDKPLPAFPRRKE